MKKVWRFLGAATGLFMLAAFALGLAAVFRAASGGVTPAQEGYPPPGATLPAPPSPTWPPGYAPPPGYPPPTYSVAELAELTAIAPTIIAEETAIIATAIAEATASVPTPFPTPGYVIGEQPIQDPDGNFSLRLLPGWWAALGGTTVLTNYDPEQVSESQTWPPGHLKIQIGVDTLQPGQTFEQWVPYWIAVETLPPPDTDFPPSTATEPQPYTLGGYQGVTYFINGEPPLMDIVLPTTDGRVIIIGLLPADSSALAEALEMLSTIQILPQPGS